MHVGLHHHCVQGPVDPPAALQQAREEAPLTQFRDAQLDVTGRGRQQPRTVTVPLRRALFGTLEAPGAVLGPIAASPGAGPVRSPGMLKSHYAPALPLRLDARRAQPGEALLAFGPEAPPGFREVLWLSLGGDLAEAAANLFAMLRRLDRPDFTGIAVMPIPDEGLGRAINDRLRRAAAPRPDRGPTS